MQKQEANKTYYSNYYMLHKILDDKIKDSYIVINEPIETKLYDHLYEQFYNEQHEVWQKFRQTYDIETLNSEQLQSNAHRNKDEYVGYWFFKQRTDNRSIHIKIGEQKLSYKPNTIVIMNSKHSFELINTQGDKPEMLVCFVYFNETDQKKIKELLFLSK